MKEEPVASGVCRALDHGGTPSLEVSRAPMLFLAESRTLEGETRLILQLGSQGKPFGETLWNMICPSSLASTGNNGSGPGQSGLAGNGHLRKEMFSIRHSLACSEPACCQHCRLRHSWISRMVTHPEHPK